MAELAGPWNQKEAQEERKELSGTLESTEDKETEPGKSWKWTDRHSVVPSNPGRCPKNPAERSNPSKVCSKNPGNFMRMLKVLISINFVILYVI